MDIEKAEELQPAVPRCCVVIWVWLKAWIVQVSVHNYARLQVSKQHRSRCYATKKSVWSYQSDKNDLTGVYTHLCETLAMKPAEVDNLLNKQSGLQGLCGFSKMNEVHAAAHSGNAEAILAQKIYVEVCLSSYFWSGFRAIGALQILENEWFACSTEHSHRTALKKNLCMTDTVTSKIKVIVDVWLVCMHVWCLCTSRIGSHSLLASMSKWNYLVSSHWS